MKRFIKLWFYLLFLPFLIGIIYIGMQYIKLQDTYMSSWEFILVLFIVIFGFSQLGVFMVTLSRKEWWRSVKDYTSLTKDYTLLIEENIRVKTCKLPNAELFRNNRKRIGLTMHQVRRETGVQISTISRVENNKAVEYNNIAILHKFYSLYKVKEII